ncbi:MAG TPA: hypothetical protein VKT76_13065 [Bradyrhizobium sp.]|nr:hypothetical protein [Bradyrhizobium sp.]
MNAIPFGKGVPAFGKAAPQGFGRKGGTASETGEPSKQDGGALDTARTVLEAANDFKDQATAAVCRRVIDASMNGQQPELSDLRIINNYFQ